MKKSDKDDKAYADKMAKMGKKGKGKNKDNPFKNALKSVKK